MSDKFEVVNGAEIDARIKAAQDALAKDASAPREISVTVKLHKHEEYPKVVYKGEVSKVVADPDAEAAAAKEGFGAFGEKPAPAKKAAKPATAVPEDSAKGV